MSQVSGIDSLKKNISEINEQPTYIHASYTTWQTGNSTTTYDTVWLFDRARHGSDTVFFRKLISDT